VQQTLFRRRHQGDAAGVLPQRQREHDQGRLLRLLRQVPRGRVDRSHALRGVRAQGPHQDRLRVAAGQGAPGLLPRTGFGELGEPP
ncbi:unnamed protein product, partial [Prorocentrum cordatum]